MTTLSASTAMSHSMGVNGFKFLSTGGTATYAAANMTAIQVLTAAAVSCTSVKGDDLSAVDCAAGTVIVGEFSSVTCATVGGELLAYLS